MQWSTAMIDYFNSKYTASPSQELIWKAAAAAAKVKQLQHLVRPLQAVDNPCPSTIKSKVGTNDEEEYLFCTRPVVECLEGADKVVAYPMDAGFAAFVNVKPTKKSFKVANLSAPLASATAANQLAATVHADGTHEYVSRAELSKILRRVKTLCCGATVYLAPAPGWCAARKSMRTPFSAASTATTCRKRRTLRSCTRTRCRKRCAPSSSTTED